MHLISTLPDSINPLLAGFILNKFIEIKFKNDIYQLVMY